MKSIFNCRQGRKCNICVRECPAQVIVNRDDNNYPTPVAGAHQLCINCGHCVTVCPAKAFIHSNMKPDSCTAINKNILPSFEEVAELLKSKRSIRRFNDRSVPSEILSELIDVAHYAPTACNQQQVCWTVFTKEV